MACGCGGGATRPPMTSGDYAAVQEAEAAGEANRFRLVRDGYDDEQFATYAAARHAATVLGGVVRTATAAT